ncbi:MAG: tRNA pseudouridine(38-40) synthase TruA [Chitinivibrionales bacterium]|nr:tRNA pseudouridine(38-40) synthase TruA [Chitinivibrionales bacterium]
MKYFCRVEYDGTNYAGWQVQDNGCSIQSVLERAFGTVLRKAVKVVGAGRTDAGVHARGQGMHVEIAEGDVPQSCEYSVNSILPTDIAIYRLQRVDDSFHARYSAVERRYVYTLVPRKQPLLFKRAMRVGFPVDWKLIEENIAQLTGTHDFTSFCASGSSVEKKICTVTQAIIARSDDRAMITIAANRFLYKMVRSLVGTLIDIGRGRITENIASIIAAKDRSRCGETAHACGLVLDYVKYRDID